MRNMVCICSATFRVFALILLGYFAIRFLIYYGQLVNGVNTFLTCTLQLLARGSITMYSSIGSISL